MDNCQKCNVSFKGEKIPDDMAKNYAGDGYWRRDIGIDGGYLGIYDGIVALQCPDCGHEFPRDESKWALEMFSKYIKVTKAITEFVERARNG